jgi:hypothetical protein
MDTSGENVSRGSFILIEPLDSQLLFGSHFAFWGANHGIQSFPLIFSSPHLLRKATHQCAKCGSMAWFNSRRRMAVVCVSRVQDTGGGDRKLATLSNDSAAVKFLAHSGMAMPFNGGVIIHHYKFTSCRNKSFAATQHCNI